MNFIWMLIVGLIAGALAKLLRPGKDPGGIFVTMALGILGSVLAGLVGRAIGFYRQPGDAPGIIMSTIGAFVVLMGYHYFMRRWRASHPAH